MLKIGSTYITKNKSTIVINSNVFHYMKKGENFTVLEYITEIEEQDEYADYIILYKGQKCHLTIKKYEHKTISQDFLLIC